MNIFFLRRIQGCQNRPVSMWRISAKQHINVKNYMRVKTHLVVLQISDERGDHHSAAPRFLQHASQPRNRHRRHLEALSGHVLSDLCTFVLWVNKTRRAHQPRQQRSAKIRSNCTRADRVKYLQTDIRRCLKRHLDSVVIGYGMNMIHVYNIYEHVHQSNN